MGNCCAGNWLLLLYAYADAGMCNCSLWIFSARSWLAANWNAPLYRFSAECVRLCLCRVSYRAHCDCCWPGPSSWLKAGPYSWLEHNLIKADSSHSFLEPVIINACDLFQTTYWALPILFFWERIAQDGWRENLISKEERGPNSSNSLTVQHKCWRRQNSGRPDLRCGRKKVS